jgi:hypothetical protein
MASVDQVVQAYRELALSYDRQGQTPMRDRFLVLAADAAFNGGRHDEAEQLRNDLLRHNPHHLLKPYRSFAEAMKSADVQNYVSALRRSHPYERLGSLLDALRSDAEGQKSADNAAIFKLADAAPSQSPQLYPTRPYDRAATAGPGSPASSLPSTPSSSSRGGEERVRAWPDQRSAVMPAAAVDEEEADSAAGSVVSSALFWLICLLSAGVAVYTLGGPFFKR